jgi:Nucleotidyltransferase/DNA polymerase involved in DNA repair
MHLDGDAFFVSVEAAKDPSLRGKPVVTGQERGIASAMSYEAKKLGITRATPVFQIRKQFPQVRIVNSDYDSYSVFSRRMFDIIRRYTSVVEEYSIDECFADFTDVSGFAENPRPTLEALKHDIHKELGISVSLGLGPTKVLAKTASKSQKPNGLTIIAGMGQGLRDIELLLDRTQISSVWGIGSATSIALRRRGVSTALELARKPLSWVEEHFPKPVAEMWYELNGISVHRVHATGIEQSETQKSIMKTRTFSPASNNKVQVFSELSKNIENACRKAREEGLCAREFSVYLKTSEFSYRRHWARLAAPTNDPFVIIPEARKLFEQIFDPTRRYRATGVSLYSLVGESAVQEDLFGISHADKDRAEVFRAADRLNRRYGRGLVHIATSLLALRREEKDERTLPFLPRGVHRRLVVPFLGDVR